MPYDRDLPIAVALQELPLRARTNLRHLHMEIANLNDLILWSLLSFAMLFVDEDYLFRPARVDAQRKVISKAGEVQVAERVRRLRE